MRLEQHVGLGYAQSTEEELKFITEVSRQTGVVLDPVYSGKAARGMAQDLQQQRQAGDTPKSLAIEHVSNVLKFQMALDALKTRKPFPAWRIETAKEEEVKRAA